MHTLKSVIVLLLLSVFSFSCSKDGESESPQFDPEEFTVTNEAHNRLTLKSKNNVAWWFHSVKINDQLIDLNDLTLYYLDGEDKTGYAIVKFEGEWFSVTKKNNQAIEINLSENSTNAERGFSFLAYRGNSWQEISISQHGLVN